MTTRTVTINNIKFDYEQLIKTFPDSIFDCMLNGYYAESDKYNISIEFPDNLHFTPNLNCAERFLNVILRRITDGNYLIPYISRHNDRFYSEDEMVRVLDYLQIQYDDNEIFDDIVDDISDISDISDQSYKDYEDYDDYDNYVDLFTRDDFSDYSDDAF